ncbi:MAG TPA: response regulator transcription factor [Acidimicrobiales bacterium]|nr:MAG: DNA-binding response regulator [Actinobacteria bacterium 21-64-8]HQU00436.1 response regulator transcription factor [Acidimicrobiales bacterium]
MSEDRRRVLVVEDDHNLAQAVADLLVQDGFDVDLRHDGDAGLAAGLERAYDVIVLDIMLPRRSGFRVCEELRAAGVNTPLLMLTAKEGEWDEVEGLDVGADDFLRKPFERSVLLARLHALVRRFERGRPSPIVVGDVALDPLQRRVIAHGREVTLTPREFALLEYLMGRVEVETARSEILDAVWGSDFDGDHNVVEVYIGYLRRKIDVEDQPSIIRTVRGVGYTVRAG